MDERSIISERLNELEMWILKKFAKMLLVENYETLAADVLVEEILDAILNDQSKAYKRTREELKRILLKYGKRIFMSDKGFEKELVDLKEKYKREQRIIMRAYNMEIDEFLSDPSFYSVF